jgi:hypothetical protein
MEEERDPDGQRSLRRAIIVFAVVEAIVIALVVFYKVSR